MAPRQKRKKASGRIREEGSAPPSPPAQHFAMPASYPVGAKSIVRFLIPSLRRQHPDLKSSEYEALPSAERAKLEANAYAEFFLSWPPNLFAFTGSFLALSGGYTQIISTQHHKRYYGDVAQECITAAERATQQWVMNLRRAFPANDAPEKDPLGFALPVESLAKHGDEAFRAQHERLKALYACVPDAMKSWWLKVFRQMQDPPEGDISDIYVLKEWDTFLAMLKLHFTADQASVGWGIREKDLESRQPRALAAIAKAMLLRNGTMATIHPARARVLPKRHTPPVGVTLRSITSNLALYRHAVEVTWSAAEARPKLPSPVPDPSLAVLLLPWPLNVPARSFLPVTPRTPPPDARDKPREAPKEAIRFKYAPPPELADIDISLHLDHCLEEAKRESGRLDLVVLPELAVDDQVLRTKVLDILHRFDVGAFISGTRSTDANGAQLNQLVLGYRRTHDAARYDLLVQSKHHPWRLDGWQIRSYQLGGQLHPAHQWWEDIAIPRRRVNFLNLGDELTICGLICEDLARQEPIADLIREVGPSLLVALLMDGPQLRSRWAARYASVFAEDPGTSVLTLTSYGMIRRYRIGNETTSPVIALWNDRGGTGQEHEIVLDPGAVGVLLHLGVKPTPEYTLDGRKESVPTHSLVFGGTHTIYPKGHPKT